MYVLHVEKVVSFHVMYYPARVSLSCRIVGTSCWVKVCFPILFDGTRRSSPFALIEGKAVQGLSPGTYYRKKRERLRSER
jgi:hypothetical protein